MENQPSYRAIYFLFVSLQFKTENPKTHNSL